MYRRNDIKEILWQEIADLIEPHISTEVGHERFINIRTTFVNNEKRIRESKQKCSGKDADEIYKLKWPFYTNLLFLKKACVQTESSSNLDVLEDDDNQAFTITDTNEETNNKLLADSVKKNIHFDFNLQKWVFISANTDASNYSQASCQDVSTMILNPYYPKDVIEHSSVKTNLSIYMPASNCSSRTSTERIELSSPSSSLSEETVDVKILNHLFLKIDKIFALHLHLLHNIKIQLL